MGASECFRGGLRGCGSVMLVSIAPGCTPDGPASELLAEAEAAGCAAPLLALALAPGAALVESTCIDSGWREELSDPRPCCASPAKSMRCRDSCAAARGTKGETSGCVCQR